MSDGELGALSVIRGLVTDRDDLVILVDWMVVEDYTADQIADAVRKPWKFADVLVEAKAALTGRVSE